MLSRTKVCLERRAIAIVAAFVCALCNNAGATWSIIIVDPVSNEVAVGAATCLTNFDLEVGLPVVIVDVGAAAAQSQVDFGAINRGIIYGQLLKNAKPSQIISMLAASDGQHQSRQYGIVDTLGRSVTFTGSNAGAYRSGITGTTSGGLVYAIQGNVLTGASVIAMAEQAVLNGGSAALPDLLMNAMEAAAAFGGDGRCSCFPEFPTACGSPPGDFEKSAHIGFMIVARSGDVDGGCNGFEGCASGDYYLNLNVPFQEEEAPDAVLQLREQFDAWKKNLTGQPDAYSPTAFEPPTLDAVAGAQSVLTITLKDYSADPIQVPIGNVSLLPDPSSDGVAAVSDAIIKDADTVQYIFTADESAGIGRYRIMVHGGDRPIVLLPLPELHVYAPADLNRDDDVDLADLDGVALCHAGPGIAQQNPSCTLNFDMDNDGDVDLRDVLRMHRDFTGPRCVKLEIATQPLNRSINCGSPFTLSVVHDANPSPFYQWYLNNAPIAGANSSSYSVAAATSGNFGDYRVELTNTCGVLSSRTAVVTPRSSCP